MNAYCAGRSASSHGEKHWNSRCFRSRRPTRAEAHSLRLPVTTSAQCRCMCVGGARRALTAPRTREVLSRAVYSKRHDDGPTSNADRHAGPRWKSSHPSGWRIRSLEGDPPGGDSGAVCGDAIRSPSGDRRVRRKAHVEGEGRRTNALPEHAAGLTAPARRRIPSGMLASGCVRSLHVRGPHDGIEDEQRDARAQMHPLRASAQPRTMASRVKAGRHARRRIPRGMLTFRRCFSRARGPLPWRHR